MEDPKDPRTWKIDYFPNVSKQHGEPPTEPLSLQRQIDFIAKDTQSAIDALNLLNLRIDDIIADQEKYASRVANIVLDLEKSLDTIYNRLLILRLIYRNMLPLTWG